MFDDSGDVSLLCCIIFLYAVCCRCSVLFSESDTCHAAAHLELSPRRFATARDCHHQTPDTITRHQKQTHTHTHLHLVVVVVVWPAV